MQLKHYNFEKVKSYCLNDLSWGIKNHSLEFYFVCSKSRDRETDTDSKPGDLLVVEDLFHFLLIKEIEE